MSVFVYVLYIHIICACQCLCKHHLREYLCVILVCKFLCIYAYIHILYACQCLCNYHLREYVCVSVRVCIIITQNMCASVFVFVS